MKLIQSDKMMNRNIKLKQLQRYINKMFGPFILGTMIYKYFRIIYIPMYFNMQYEEVKQARNTPFKVK